MTVEKANAGEALSSFLVEEVDKEDARRGSLETRGLAVTSVATGLVAIVGLAQKILPAGFSVDNRPAVTTIFIGLIILAISAVSGALLNLPTRFSLVDPIELQQLAQSTWSNEIKESQKRIFASRALYLRQLQRANDRRGILLFIAVLGLAVAAASFATSLSFILV